MELWFWILGWILSILTIAGNGFIIFLVCNKRQLRTKTNAFIVSLAVADFFVGVSVVPSSFICDITGGCDWPAEGAKLTRVIRFLFGFASALNLCSLVLDRYIAVVKPFKYLTFMTSCRVIQFIFFSWTIPLGFATILPFLVLPILRSYTNFFWMSLEIFSCCVVTFCTFSMVRIALKHDQSSAILAKQLRFNHSGLTFNTHDKSAVKMMAIVVALFLTCYGIYLRCDFVLLFFHQASCNDVRYKIPIFVSNSAVNPFAYAFFKRDIKKEIKKLVCRTTFKKDNRIEPIDRGNSCSNV